MKIKVNKTQLEALDVLLSLMLKVHKPQDMAEKLLHRLVRQMWEKVSIKLTKSVSEHKIKHSLNLTPAEAMGFHLWFHQKIGDDFLESYKYESIVCQSIVDDIDREYA